MQRSDGRILTTHAGSLPRPPGLVDLLARQSRGDAPDPVVLGAVVDAAVAEAVAAQARVGIDVANDGEMGRESFVTYVQHRLSGFGPAPGGVEVVRQWQDIADFPGFAEIRQAQRSARTQVSLVRPPWAVSEVRSLGSAAINTECDRLTTAVAAVGAGHAMAAEPPVVALTGPPGAPFVETFLTSPSPGIVATAMGNGHYPTLEDYVNAVADALAVEYRSIVAHGHVLQIDAPDLAMESHVFFAGRPRAEFLAFVDVVIDAVNRALTGIPSERVRLHVCWGNYGGPHTCDIPVAELLPRLYRARVGGLLLSMANPRHAHEHRELARTPLPDGWLLAAGVIDVTTNYVEHPQIVADRIEAVANAVGDPSRVLACTDCGFDTAAGFGLVAADVAWEKLRSLRAGADLATSRLF